MQRARPARSSAALVGGALSLAACAAIGIGIRAAGNGPLAADVAWRSFSGTLRSPALDAASFVLNDAGSQLIVGVVLPVLIAVAFIAVRRGWSATAVLLGGVLSAPLVDALKSQLLRPRPEGGLVGVSRTAYPSGHVANLTTIVVIVALLLAIRWVWIAGAGLVLAMAFSRTYLDVHWLTDDLGGILLGAGLGFVIWGALASRIRTETQEKRQ